MSKYANNRGSSAFRWTTIVGAVIVVAFAASKIIVAAVRNAQDSGGQSGPVAQNIAASLTYFLCVVGLTLLGVLVFRLPQWRLRRRALRGHEASVAVGAWGLESLSDQIDSFVESRAGEKEVPLLGLDISLVGTRAGVQVWTGWRPRMVVEAAWADISHVALSSVLDRGRRYAGISLTVQSGALAHQFDFMVNGRGVAGLFPRREDDLERIILAIEEARRSA